MLGRSITPLLALATWFVTAGLAAQSAPPTEEIKCEILILGGTFGGVAAAVGAAGHDVWVIEDSDWVGGQVTAQGVAPLDEHRYIETFGGTASYYRFRDDVRRRSGGRSNPGGGWVSRLCFEPRVGLAVLQDMLTQAGAKTLLEAQVIDATQAADRITTVTVRRHDGTTVRFRPRFVLDATDLGDFLALAHLEHRLGAEARAETGEPHAAAKADSRRTQSFTYSFAVEFRPGEKHVIAKPRDYEHWRDSQPYTLNLGGSESRPQSYRFFAHAPGTAGPFWTYRRLSDTVALINWPGNDYRGAPIQSADQDEARRLSLGFLYWLQTECPRDDGGQGYPELLLRPDIMGTADGLSKRPYVREGRRLVARTLIREQDLVTVGPRARLWSDSVGIGFYPIDIHACAGDPPGVTGRGIPTQPFQIPLGALVPVRVRNVLAAGKCLGVTHVTNGAYRLHPVEWNTGESAGRIAAFCVERRVDPADVLDDPRLLRTAQLALLRAGIPLFWAIDVPLTDPSFTAVQAISVWEGAPDTKGLDFQPTPDRRAAIERRLAAAQAALGVR